MLRMYEQSYANVHRGIYHLSQVSTDIYEKARATVAAFIGTPDSREIVFVRNATEAVNLVAYSWGEKFLQPGDEVLIRSEEHTSELQSLVRNPYAVHSLNKKK